MYVDCIYLFILIFPGRFARGTDQHFVKFVQRTPKNGRTGARHFIGETIAIRNEKLGSPQR